MHNQDYIFIFDRLLSKMSEKMYLSWLVSDLHFGATHNVKAFTWEWLEIVCRWKSSNSHSWKSIRRMTNGCFLLFFLCLLQLILSICVFVLVLVLFHGFDPILSLHIIHMIALRSRTTLFSCVLSIFLITLKLNWRTNVSPLQTFDKFTIWFFYLNSTFFFM